MLWYDAVGNAVVVGLIIRLGVVKRVRLLWGGLVNGCFRGWRRCSSYNQLLIVVFTLIWRIFKVWHDNGELGLLLILSLEKHVALATLKWH